MVVGTFHPTLISWLGRDSWWEVCCNSDMFPWKVTIFSPLTPLKIGLVCMWHVTCNIVNCSGNVPCKISGFQQQIYLMFVSVRGLKHTLKSQVKSIERLRFSWRLLWKMYLATFLRFGKSPAFLSLWFCLSFSQPETQYLFYYLHPVNSDSILIFPSLVL